LVQDARRALGHLLDRVNGQPSRAMSVCGVTGSLGRGAASRLLVAALEASGISAVRIAPGNPRRRGEGPERVQRRPRRARGRARGAWVLPLSGAAREAGRVGGVRFGGAVSLRSTPGQHQGRGSASSAFEAAADLFRMLPKAAVAVLNKDAPAAE